MIVMHRLAVVAFIVSAATAWSQQYAKQYPMQYPTKPVRIVTAEVGSANDLAARMVAQGLTHVFGQQFIVDNRGGGMCIDIVARAQPDAYTLLFFGSAVWTSPFMRDNWPWDPTRDLTAITAGVSSPNVLAVHPSVAVKSAAELIALARAKPGYLNWRLNYCDCTCDYSLKKLTG